MPVELEWTGVRVFITGHTGFMGSWLSLTLERFGAVVTGFSLDPPTVPSLFEAAEVAKGMVDRRGDVRNGATLRAALLESGASVVFHLAAQPLVLESYRDPLLTLDTNILGTATILDVIREVTSVRAVVVVTTDKCYENREWPWGYRENDALGGFDPYSASKACAELVVASFRRSFFTSGRVGIATVRAGNVIGGGDWALERLIPDYYRARAKGQAMQVREPSAVRPWQHVLEPIAGYLRLATCLTIDSQAYAEAWNLGPADADCRSVDWVLRTIRGFSDEGEGPTPEVNMVAMHEARLLKLDSSKARSRIGWSPRWSLEEALRMVDRWYGAFERGSDMRRVTVTQIEDYFSLPLNSGRRPQ